MHPKNDPFPVSTVIRIGATQDNARCMHTYISSHRAPDGPLFVLTTHPFLTWSDMVGLLTYCLPDMPNITPTPFELVVLLLLHQPVFQIVPSRF